MSDDRVVGAVVAHIGRVGLAERDLLPSPKPIKFITGSRGEGGEDEGARVTGTKRVRLLASTHPDHLAVSPSSSRLLDASNPD
jgi:hypothetical protein